MVARSHRVTPASSAAKPTLGFRRSTSLVSIEILARQTDGDATIRPKHRVGVLGKIVRGKAPVSTTGRRRRSARSGGFRSRRTRGPVRAGTLGSARGFARCAVSPHRLPPRHWRQRRSPIPRIRRFEWPPSPWDGCEAASPLRAPFRPVCWIGSSGPIPPRTGRVRHWGRRAPIAWLDVRCSTRGVVGERHSRLLHAGRLPHRADVRWLDAALPVLRPPLFRPRRARPLAAPRPVVRASWRSASGRAASPRAAS